MRSVYLTFVCIAVITTSLFCGQALAVEEVMIYKLWGGLEGRHAYQVELFKLAMQKTEMDYPAYTLTYYNQRLGSLRGRREIARGELINVYIAPPRPADGPLESQIISIPVPLLKGLLGYRKLIVRTKDIQLFEKIENDEQLKAFQVGQARGWPDVEVYRHNGYPIIDSGAFGDLFLMLEQKRFDYLPLGIMEVERALSSYSAKSDSLSILSNIYIYYPHPAIFHLSAKQPRLAERLEAGLRLSMEDGSMDRLFASHFATYLKELSERTGPLIVLGNPNLDSDMGLSEPLLSPGSNIHGNSIH